MEDTYGAYTIIREDELNRLRFRIGDLEEQRHKLLAVITGLERDVDGWKKAYEAERRTTEFLTNWDTQQKFINKLQKAHEEEYRMRLALQEKAVADHKEMRGLRAEVEEYVRLKDLAEEAAGYWRQKYRELKLEAEKEMPKVTEIVNIHDMPPGKFGWTQPLAIVRDEYGRALDVLPGYWVYPNKSNVHTVAIYRVSETEYRIAEETDTYES